jgi:hypothetical protein
MYNDTQYIVGLPVNVQTLFKASAFEANARGPAVELVQQSLKAEGIDCDVHKIQVSCYSA